MDYVRGLGAAVERQRVSDHLDRCDACTVLATQLKELAAVAREDIARTGPDAAFDAALAIFTVGPAARHRGCEVARRIFDSAHAPDDRRTDSDEPRHLLFQTTAVGIDLQVSSGADRVVVRGHIIERASGAPLVADIRVEREWDAPALTRARSEGLFTVSYPSPVPVLLRIVVDGALHGIALPLDVSLTPDPAS